MNVPNLDDMNEAELLEFSSAVRLLNDYALRVRLARQLRLAGRIQDALEYERINDQIYNQLPDEFKW